MSFLRRSVAPVALVLLGAVACAAPPAAAATPGPLFGVSAGAGRGVMDYVRLGTPFAHERAGGVALGLHAARAFDAEFALGLRGLAWQRASGNADGDDETWAFTLGAVVLTWRPRGGGFFVRGGPGWGRAEVELDYGDVKVAGAESGPAALLACGWTWSLGRGVALGPAAEIGAVRLDEGWRADLGTLAVELSWQP